MIDSFLVRAVVIPIYIIIVIFTVFLLWKNSAASDSLKNCGILLASLLPILIAILPYLNSQVQKNTYTYVLFYDSVKKSIITGNDINAYAGVTRSLIGDLKQDYLQAETPVDFMADKGADLIEKSIMTNLIFRFSQIWNPGDVEYGLPNMQAATYKSSNLPDIKISLEQIKQEFSQNPLIQQLNTKGGAQISLPTNSTLKVKREKRMIIIDNPQFSIEIQLTGSMSGRLQQGIPGVLEPDSTNPYRYYTVAFAVKVSMSSKKFNRYSPQMPEYQKFYDNICRVLSTMDWSTVNTKVEKSLLDKAVNKILETK